MSCEEDDGVHPDRALQDVDPEKDSDTNITLSQCTTVFFISGLLFTTFIR